MKLIKLLLCEGITANLFSPSAYGLIQSLPRTQMSPRLGVEKQCVKSKLGPANLVQQCGPHIKAGQSDNVATAHELYCSAKAFI